MRGINTNGYEQRMKKNKADKKLVEIVCTKINNEN
jgi:hypothetical protein